MYYAYILLCADGSYYIGSTSNIEKRLHAHNNLKSGAHYTKIRRPVTLKYKEEFETLREAKQREYILKQMNRSEKERLISRNYKS